MTPALINLLTITSVRFWTSIAGVLASIILRVFDRRWHAASQRELECIIDAIDRGRRNPTIVFLFELAQPLDSTPVELLTPDDTE